MNILDFSGGVSLIGHSLGSLILFDLLSGQPRTEEEEVKDIPEGEQDPGVQDLNDSFKEHIYFLKSIFLNFGLLLFIVE